MSGRGKAVKRKKLGEHRLTRAKFNKYIMAADDETAPAGKTSEPTPTPRAGQADDTTVVTSPAPVTKLKGTKDIKKLKEKAESLKQRLESLRDMDEDIGRSKNTALNMIRSHAKKNKKTRDSLLSEAAARAEETLFPVEDAIKGHEDLLSRITSACSSTNPDQNLLQHLLGESPPDVAFTRAGVAFVPGLLKDGKSPETGHIRTVTFTPEPKPRRAPDLVRVYDAVSLKPADLPSDMLEVAKASACNDKGKPVIFSCPSLEFDLSTASPDLSLPTRTVVSNTPPLTLPPTRGCRIQTMRRVLMTTPLDIRRGQRVMLRVNVKFTLLQELPRNVMLFELGLTSCPVDSNCNNAVGLSVTISRRQEYDSKLSRIVRYDNCTDSVDELCDNKARISDGVDLCVLLVRNSNVAYFYDADCDWVTFVEGVDFKRPLWVTVSLGQPKWGSVTAKLVTGKHLTPKHPPSILGHPDVV